MNNRRNDLLVASARKYCKCVVSGKTIKYNQVIKENDNTAFSGITLTANNNGSVTVNGTATDNINNIYICGYWNNPEFAKIGHKYFMITGLKDTEGVLADLLVGSGAEWAYGYPVDMGDGCIVEAKTTSETPTTIYGIRLRINEGANFNNKTIYPMLIDLTELGLDEIENVDDFYETELGQYVKRGNYLGYSDGEMLNCEAPFTFKGANLLNLHRTKGTLSGFANTTPRTFEEGKYYFGLSANNYYSDTIQYFAINGNTITLKQTTVAYGVVFPVKVKANTLYKIHYDCSSTYSYRVGWYDIDGNFISFNSGTDNFRSPSNAYWATICITSETTNVNVTFTNIIFYENIWNEIWENGEIDNQTGQDIANASRIRNVGYMNVLPNTTIISRFNSWILFYFYDKNKNYLGHTELEGNGTFKVPSNCVYMRFYAFAYQYNNNISIFYAEYQPSCEINYPQSLKVGYNQLLQNGNFANTSTWTANGGTITATDNKLTYTVVSHASTNGIECAIKFDTNGDYHKFFVCFDATTSIYSTHGDILLNNNLFISDITIFSSSTHHEHIITSNKNGTLILNFRFNTSDLYLSNGDTVSLSNFMIIDLTQLYGAGKEPTSVNDFYATELGKYVKKKIYFDYSQENSVYYFENYIFPKLQKGDTFQTWNGKVKRTMTIVDLSALTWTNFDNVYYCNLPSAKAPETGYIPVNAIADKYNVVSFIYWSETGENETLCLFSDKDLFIRSSQAPTGYLLIEIETSDNYVDISFIVENFNTTFYETNSNGEIREVLFAKELGLVLNSLGVDDNNFIECDSLSDLREETRGWWFNSYDNLSALYVKMPSSEWETKRLTFVGYATKLPTQMINRNTIECISDNDIYLDFTKE